MDRETGSDQSPFETSSSILYVDAPTYSNSSNGIKCLYYAARDLARSGVNVRFVPRNVRSFSKVLPDEFRGIQSTPHWNLKSGSYLICSESAPKKVVEHARRKGLKIIWWYLAPNGVLDNQKARPLGDEAVLPFSSYILDDYCEKFWFYQPPVDREWSRAIRSHRPNSSQKQIQLAFYTGKGRLRYLDSRLRAFAYDAKTHVITRAQPKTREGLFRVLSEVDGLITFDDLSQLSVEAMSLGVPVYQANPLFDTSTAKNFATDLSRLMTHDPQAFIDLVGKKRNGTGKTIRMDRLYDKNEQTLEGVRSLMIDRQNWDLQSSEILHQRIKDYGRRLRSKRALLPFYNGESPDSQLIKIYMMSIRESPARSLALYLLIRIYGRLGEIFYVLGLANIFSYITSKCIRRAARRLTGLLDA